MRVVGVGELGRPGLGEAGVDVGDQFGVGRSGVGDPVAVAAGGPRDEAVGAESAQVVADLPGRWPGGGEAEQLGEPPAQVGVAEPAWEQPEHQQHLQQRLRAVITQA